MDSTHISNTVKNIVNEINNEILTFESNFYEAVDIKNIVDFVTEQGNLFEPKMNLSLEEYFEEYEAETQKEELQRLCNSNDPVKDLVEGISLKLCFIFELLGLNETLKSFQSAISECRENCWNFIYEPNTGEIYNSALEQVGRYNDLMKAIISKDDYLAKNFLINKLQGILKETSTIIDLYNLQPHNEADVRKTVFHTLRLFYPDIVREFPISNITKNYFVDMAIRSLKVGIEYKYVNSEKEVRRILDEIYTDVHGYSESSDLKYFIAVLYMTGAYTTDAAIQADFKVKRINNWEIIICKGHGDRKTNWDKQR